MVVGFSASHASELIRWFTPSQQPVRRSFGLTKNSQRHSIEIRQRDVNRWPFCILTEFSASQSPEHRVLLVAPLSGHFAFILRELVAGLVEQANVSVTDWLNTRYVPMEASEFGFDDNVEVIEQSLRLIGPGTHVIALCQGVMPALTATAIVAQSNPDLAPRSLTLIGGPADPLANPTRVVRLLRQHSLKWLEANVLDRVSLAYPGARRLVYPAHLQLSALLAYLHRHLTSGGELFRKVFNDDGLDPVSFPFLNQFISLMDLPAKYFLENIRKVFQDRDPWTGTLSWRNEPVEFTAIDNTALSTIEGAEDDIAAPGQTSAAHELCPNVADDMRHSLVVPGSGHFSLFHGKICREQVLPEIRRFLYHAQAQRACRRITASLEA